jgi:hypothetical protein
LTLVDSSTTNYDQHYFDTVMGTTMWGCMTSLWVRLAGLVVAALLQWAPVTAEPEHISQALKTWPPTS